MKRNFTLFTVLSLISFFLINYSSRSDADLEKIKKNLPQLLGANNEGMEFALGVFPAWIENRPPNGVGSPSFRLFIVSNQDVNVKVSIEAKNWTRDFSAKRDQVIEVIIPDTIAQMSKKIRDRDVPEPAQVYVGGAIMVTSDAPIVCYGVLRYPYTADGYLALPISALGRDYVVAGYAGPTKDPDPAGQFLTSYTAIVGAFDNTKVTFSYGGKADGWVLTSEGDTLRAEEIMNKTLNKGDLWLIPSRGPYPDVTGSHVYSDKPVACFSGNFCAYVPVGKAACDYVIEQDMPMYVWGSRYYITPIYGRNKNPVVRLFASENNTAIYRNGFSDQVCTIPSKFGPENVGWIEVRASEDTSKPVTLLSLKRFNVVQYNPGEQDDNIRAEPFSMTVIPVEQFQDHVVFSTPGTKNGLKYQKNYVNLVYQATEINQIPDDLEIGIVNSLDEVVWTDIAMKFDGAPGEEIIDPTNPNPERKFYCKQIKLPENGVYHIRANDKFGAYLYGFSDYDSYGFPISTQLIDLERPDTVRPIFEYTIDCEGYVPSRVFGGKKPAFVKDMPEESDFRSNMGFIFFDNERSKNYIFQVNPYIPGNDRYVEWSLTPIDPKRDAQARITFYDRGGNDTTLIIEYFAARLAISPVVKNFGKFKIGETKTFPFKIINRTIETYSKLATLMLRKGDQGFTLNYSFDPALPIPPGETRDFTVTFTAPGEGEFRDEIGVGDSCYFDYLSVVEAGVGIPKITVSEASFPTTNVGEEIGPIKAIIKNTGNARLEITGVKGPDNLVFRTDLKTLGIWPDSSLTLNPNKELEFNVWFKPEAAKAYRDSIVFVNDSDGDDSVCVLTGDGFKGISEENFLNKPFSVKILPNPLDSRGGQLEFDNPADGTVEIILFNSLNQQVAVLHSGWMKAGRQSIRIPVETLPSGAYTYRIDTGKNAAVGNFVINK